MPDSIKNRLLSEDDFWKYAEPDASYLLFVTVWGKLFKRKIWDTLRFPMVRFAEDEFILPSIVSQCDRIFVSDCIAYKQTLSSSSLVRSAYSIEKLSVPKSKLSVADHLITKGYYLFALKKVENAIADTCNARQSLRNNIAGKEFAQIIQSTRILTLKLSPHISVKKRFKLFIFTRFPHLYFKLTKFLYNLKNKR